MFSDSFLKALKWLVLAEAAVIGTTCFIWTNEHKTGEWVLLGVLSYGLMYVMSYFWKDFRDKLLLWSIGVFLVLSFATPYVPAAIFVISGYRYFDADPNLIWGLTVGILGVPVMMMIFKKYD